MTQANDAQRVWSLKLGDLAAPGWLTQWIDERTTHVGECRLWKGYCNNEGATPQFTMGGRKWQVRRWILMQIKPDADESLRMQRNCSQPTCVAHAHLEAIRPTDNTAWLTEIGRYNPNATRHRKFIGPATPTLHKRRDLTDEERAEIVRLRTVENMPLEKIARRLHIRSCTVSGVWKEHIEEQRKAEAARLLASGCSWTQTAAQMSMSRRTLRRLVGGPADDGEPEATSKSFELRVTTGRIPSIFSLAEALA